MAITIQDQPDNSYVYPAYAPIEYLLSSDNTAQSGFKIICKVYYGAIAQLVSTQQINIRPSTTQAILSIQDVVKSFVTSQYSLLAGDSVGIQNSAFSAFNVTFQEYYDGQLQGQLEVSDSLYVTNASPTYIQFASNDWQEYQIANGSVQKLLLSNFNNNKIQDSYLSAAFSSSDNWLKVKDDQKLQIQWVQRSGTSNFTVELLTIGADFGTLSVSNLYNPNTTEGYYSLDVGRQEITAHAWDNAPVFTNAKYYAICINSASAAPFNSKRYLYCIDDCNTNYTPYELHYLNRWGGYDSFTFDGKSNQTTSVNKTFAKYNTRTIGSSSVTHNTYAQRKRAFNTSLRDSYTLNSRLLHDFEVEGLEDLFSSPEVYWRNGNNFESVNITGSTFEHAKSENGKVYSMQLQMEIDNSDKRQW